MYIINKSVDSTCTSSKPIAMIIEKTVTRQASTFLSDRDVIQTDLLDVDEGDLTFWTVVS